MHAYGTESCACDRQDVGDKKRLPGAWRGNKEKDFREYMKYEAKGGE